jgi:murein DD-endopeptidase MepM/ murein hydrolase activator NlpD
MKFIFSPIKSFFITQGFGANTVCIHNTNGSVRTCDGNNPPAGFRSVYSRMKGHNGLDLIAGSWEHCYASQSGTVVEVSTEESRGLGVGIITKDKYYCNETKTKEHFLIRYWHFWANNVVEGQEVKVGDLIGYCGSTGYSTSVHLHLEVKPVKVKFNKDGSYKSHTNILQDNGYFGAVNPLPYCETQIQAIQFAGMWRQVKELIAKVSDLIGDKLR